ncbi:hypothetical protein DNTS_016407 [Danionella cerebrum]|uniref:B30.2/SPRY domain-containing protein n=1 Tax=Danionella cerebrum TaxID=2873325 RepID=A0A553Q636_9TELE|nr:hypothetical protein DNTS_016407 [Danionella translucida]
MIDISLSGKISSKPAASLAPLSPAVWSASRRSLRSQQLSLEYGGKNRIRPGLRKYACDLTLDPNTAHTQIILEGNTKAVYVKENQLYPDHPERFKKQEQILFREPLMGRCYWEAKWSGPGHMGVTYKGICRDSGTETWFGLNDKSWSLYCGDQYYTVWYKNNSTDVWGPSARSNRVGVFLDMSASTLSFYSVSDTNTFTHLYTLHNTFNNTDNEPLYAGFGVYPESSVTLCKI